MRRQCAHERDPGFEEIKLYEHTQSETQIGSIGIIIIAQILNMNFFPLVHQVFAVVV